MKRGERIRRMEAQFNEGIPRQRLFERFRDEVKEKKQDQLAFDIASIIDPELRRRHMGKIRLITGLVLLQALLMAMLALGLLAEHGLIPAIAGALFAAAIPGGFAIGMYRCQLSAYNVFIILMALGLFRHLNDFWSAPLVSLLDIAWAGSLLGLAFYTRSCVFPHYGPFGLQREDSGEPCFPDKV